LLLLLPVLPAIPQGIVIFFEELRISGAARIIGCPILRGLIAKGGMFVLAVAFAFAFGIERDLQSRVKARREAAYRSAEGWSEAQTAKRLIYCCCFCSCFCRCIFFLRF
jgi:hypothetical protein